MRRASLIVLLLILTNWLPLSAQTTPSSSASWDVVDLMLVNLRQEIIGLRNSILNLQPQIEELQRQVLRLQSDLAQSEQHSSDLQAELDRQKIKLDDLSKRLEASEQLLKDKEAEYLAALDKIKKDHQTAIDNLQKMELLKTAALTATGIIAVLESIWLAVLYLFHHVI
jgi:chromosome segregation ATPase